MTEAGLSLLQFPAQRIQTRNDGVGFLLAFFVQSPCPWFLDALGASSYNGCLRDWAKPPMRNPTVSISENDTLARLGQAMKAWNSNTTEAFDGITDRLGATHAGLEELFAAEVAATAKG